MDDSVDGGKAQKVERLLKLLFFIIRDPDVPHHYYSTPPFAVGHVSVRISCIRKSDSRLGGIMKKGKKRGKDKSGKR